MSEREETESVRIAGIGTSRGMLTIDLNIKVTGDISDVLPIVQDEFTKAATAVTQLEVRNAIIRIGERLSLKTPVRDVGIFLIGDSVRFTHDPSKDGSYNAEARVVRKALHMSRGVITDRSDSHGICYSVRTGDCTLWAEPSELEKL